MAATTVLRGPKSPQEPPKTPKVVDLGSLFGSFWVVLGVVLACFRVRSVDSIHRFDSMMPFVDSVQLDSLLRCVASSTAYRLNDSQFSILNSQFLVPNSQFSVRTSRFSVFNSQFSILNYQFSALSSQCPVLGSQFSVFSSHLSILGSQCSVLDSQFSILCSQFVVLSSASFQLSILDSQFLGSTSGSESSTRFVGSIHWFDFFMRFVHSCIACKSNHTSSPQHPFDSTMPPGGMREAIK